MEILVGILAFLVAVLAVLQGWQMKRRGNPNSFNSKLDTINDQLNNIGTRLEKLDTISAQLGRMEQRLSDIWDKVNK